MSKKKTCTKCGDELPATTEYFHAMENGKYGIRGTCKVCAAAYRKIYSSTDEYKKRARERQAKWRKENPEKSLSMSREYYKKHRVKQNAKKREKLKNDPEYREKVRERGRKYRASGRRAEMNAKPENREKARLRSKKRRQNPEKREHDRKVFAIWLDSHKEQVRQMHIDNRKGLSPSYVAQCMKISVKDLDPEIYKVKKAIIKLKRELKSHNIKIR